MIMTTGKFDYFQSIAIQSIPKVGCVFPECRMRQYRVEDYREHAPLFLMVKYLKIISVTPDHFHQNEFKSEILFLHIEHDQIVNPILNMTRMN